MTDHRNKLHPLEYIRQSQDWSYQQLADKIHAKTKFRRDQESWRRICQGLTENPHHRTRYAMQLFLDTWPATPVASEMGR